MKQRRKKNMKSIFFYLIAGVVLFSGCNPSPPELKPPDLKISVPEEDGESEIPVPVAEVKSKEVNFPVVEKLKAIVIPRIEFVNTPLEDAVAFLVQRGREIDPTGEGINVIFAKELDAKRRATQVTLELTNVPLSDALAYCTQLADVKMDLEEHAVVLSAGSGDPTENLSLFADPADAVALRAKLKTLIVPAVEFHETPLFDALDFLRTRAAELDVETPENQRGVDIILNVPPDSGIDVESKRITLKLSNVPLGEAFRYTTELAGLEYRLEGGVIVISAPETP